MANRRGEGESRRLDAAGSARAGRGADGIGRAGVRVLAIAAAGGLALALLVLGIDVVLVSFGGVLVAVLLHAFGGAVERRTRLSYRSALTVVLLLILIGSGFAAWFLAPHVARQIDQLAVKLPAIAAEAEALLERHGWGRWILEQIGDVGLAEAILSDGAGIVSAATRWSTYAILALFVGLFGAYNPGLYRDGLVHLFPERRRAWARELVQELTYTLRWFLIGQGITMVIIGVSTTLVLWIFDVPLAIVLGLIVGLLGFIPYLGPIIGAVPVALIAATQGAAILVYVLIAYTAVQILEGYVAVPLVQERTVYLPPVFTLTFQILLGAVVGVIGLVLATPIAAVVLVLSRFYRRDVLGDAEVAMRPRRRAA